MSTLIAFDKIIKANLIWVNQYNNIAFAFKPTKLSVNGCFIEPNEVAGYIHEFPHETLIERARRLDLIDRFEAKFKATLYDGNTYECLGAKALEMWNAYRSFIFSKQKSKHEKRRTGS